LAADAPPRAEALAVALRQTEKTAGTTPMSVYTVHEPPLRAAETSPDPERYVFVREGFYVWAFLLTPLWMLWHRLWLALLIYVVVTAGLESALNIIGVGAGMHFLVALLISLLVGIEASTLRRFALARRRFRQVGVVGGSNTEAAERRFFDTLAKAEPGQSGRPRPSPSVPPRLPPMPQSPDIVGLFPEPGASR
jgi:Protein of unknown function (DUF2628)